MGEDFPFRFADGVALGDGEPDLFFAEALGEGTADSFFVVDDFFFLCGVGVGVAVERIFLIFSPTVSSAERAVCANERTNTDAMKARITIDAS